MRDKFNENFYLKIANHSELGKSIDCITTSFCSFEPTSKSLALMKSEFCRYAQLFIERSIKDGHTLIAVSEDDEIAACLVSEKIKNSPEGIEGVSSRLDPVISILGDLDNMLFNEENIDEKDFFHVLMIGAFSRFSGNKLAEKLLIKQEEQARLEGYKYIFAEATGPVSQYLFKKMGYEVRYSINYKKYEFEGKFVFSNIDDCKTCDLVIKKLV